MDVLFTRKEVRGYQWFGSRVLHGRGGEDILMNTKYSLPSKRRDIEESHQHVLFPNLPSFICKGF